MTDGPNGPVIDLLSEVRKFCTRCKVEKGAEEFYRDKTRPNGLFSWCRPCHKEDQQLRHAKDPLRRRRLQMQRDYGISWEEYQEQMQRQQGVCLICGATCPSGKALSVDHCHDTGKVRGLLCAPCNLGIGNFRDDPARLRAAADYLEGVCP